MTEALFVYSRKEWEIFPAAAELSILFYDTVIIFVRYCPKIVGPFWIFDRKLAVSVQEIGIKSPQEHLPGFLDKSNYLNEIVTLI